MSFKISIVKGRPNFESLPAAKIIDYPLEKREYKPFAQCRLCLNEAAFIVRLWAFETKHHGDSILRACLNLDPGHSESHIDLMLDSSHRLTSTVETRGKREAFSQFPLPEPQLSRFDGEDEQGRYWGGTISLPIDVLKTLYPSISLSKGARIKGNLYKICHNPEYTHYGSFYPVDFNSSAPYAPEFFGDFEIVAY